MALVTPFKEDMSVDYEALERLVEFQLRNGTDYLVVLGTTGETPTLNDEERRQIVDTVVRVNAGRVPIVLGIGGNNTMGVIEQIRKTDFTNIDAILSVSPYYNKPSQEGLYQHYKAIAESTYMPIIIYNVPGRTGANISAETTLRLAHDFQNIVAIKEASGNISQIAELASLVRDKMDIYSGNDDQIVPILSLGGKGVISVLSNILPKETHNICEEFFKGNIELINDFLMALAEEQIKAAFKGSGSKN